MYVLNNGREVVSGVGDTMTTAIGIIFLDQIQVRFDFSLSLSSFWIASCHISVTCRNV